MNTAISSFIAGLATLFAVTSIALTTPVRAELPTMKIDAPTVLIDQQR